MQLNPFARIALATHYYATGPALDLEGFLQGRTDELIFVAHPLFEGAGESQCRVYRGGVLVDSWTRRHSTGVKGFVEDLWRTVRWCSRDKGVSDLFIGGDNLLALAGLWLRWSGRVRSVVLYSIDFVPKRFENPLLNRVYHAIDAFAAEHVDVVWNVSPEIERARRDRDGARPVAPQIVVPVGAHVGRITRGPAAIDSRHKVAFMGHLLEKQGLQLAIEALPLIRSSVPDASLLVIGDGPFASALKSLAEQHGVADAVEFTGFVKDHEKIERMLAQSALAIAPYTPDPMSFTRFADPGKIKTYLACGLPVVLTDVAAIGAEVEAAGAGRVIPYEVQALADAVVSYLSNPVMLEAARAAAGRLGETFGYDKIFASALQATHELVKH
jgi:glycosyltransferase involved in cell wall biosynthesis